MGVKRWFCPVYKPPSVSDKSSPIYPRWHSTKRPTFWSTGGSYQYVWTCSREDWPFHQILFRSQSLTHHSITVEPRETGCVVSDPLPAFSDIRIAPDPFTRRREDFPQQTLKREHRRSSIRSEPPVSMNNFLAILTFFRLSNYYSKVEYCPDSLNVWGTLI